MTTDTRSTDAASPTLHLGDDLHLGEELRLPLEATTQTFCVLAVRGAGKTHTATVLAEELLGAGQRVLVIDPQGVWYGLATPAARGTPARVPASPVRVVGGDHGSSPLVAGGGAAVADAFLRGGASTVVDLSLLRREESRVVVADLLEELYHRNREPCHVIVDEADLFCPQRASAGAVVRSSGAVEDLARRGRARGIGLTVISQRSAEVAKSVISQTEVLIVLRTTSPRDRAAIDEWVSQHGAEAQRQELLAELAVLPNGTGYLWSPGWLGRFSRVRFRARRTADTSATPAVRVPAGGQPRAGALHSPLAGDPSSAPTRRLQRGPDAATADPSTVAPREDRTPHDLSAAAARVWLSLDFNRPYPLSDAELERVVGHAGLLAEALSELTGRGLTVADRHGTRLAAGRLRDRGPRVG